VAEGELVRFGPERRRGPPSIRRWSRGALPPPGTRRRREVCAMEEIDRARVNRLRLGELVPDLLVVASGTGFGGSG